MGIFDFIKRNRKPKSESAEKETINFSLTPNNNGKKEISANRITDKLDENNEIVLTEDEIQIYIDQEINERLLFDSKREFNLSDLDPLFQEAAEIIVIGQQGSASLIQRKLKLGYERAGKLIDELELTGIVSPFDGSRARTVLISDMYQLELLFQSKIRNKRYIHFKKHILSLHEEFITSKVKGLLTAQEVAKENEMKEILKQEILDKENRKINKEKSRQLKTQVRKELIEEGVLSNLNESDLNRREQIPQDVLDRVWNRDGGKCVICGSQEKIEFDHIIPFSKGGSNTYRNIQILCENCNREKSNKIG